MVTEFLDLQTARAFERKESKRKAAESFTRRRNEAQSSALMLHYDDAVTLISPNEFSDVVANFVLQPSISSEIEKPKQMRLQLSTFASTADRYGVPDRVAASLASAMPGDIRLVGSDDLK